MARKQKPDEGPAGLAPWMATFSDLMNLLLCFFVLLFSMSTVDAEKFEQVVASFQSSFSIFEGGATSIGDGNLISTGISQLNELNDYYNNMGLNKEDAENEQIDSMEQYQNQLEQNMIEQSEAMGEKIDEMLQSSGIADSVSVDVETQYVQLTLNGALLFDSGSAKIREDSLPLVSQVGEILRYYNSNLIQIIGHTDSVPQTGDKYSDNWELSQGRSYSVLSYLRDIKGLDTKKLECSGRGEYEPIASNGTAEGRNQNRRVEIKIFNELSSQ